MAKTVIGFFEQVSEAQRVLQDLPRPQALNRGDYQPHRLPRAVRPRSWTVIGCHR